MAFEIPGRKITRVCGASSLATKKHHFVKLHTDGTAIITAAVTDRPYGLLQNNPGVGQEAEIMRDGVSKCVAGAGGVAIGNLIGTANNGTGVPYAFGADTTKFIVGVALSDAAAGELFSLDFSCVSPPRGA